MFEELKIMADNIARDAGQWANDAIDESLIDMSDMNREQLTFGLNADGEQVNPQYRSDAYAMLKQSIGSRSSMGIPDLKLTGDFHSSIFAERQGDQIVFGATDSKAPDLISKYDRVLGLTLDNTRLSIDGHIIPVLLTRIQAQFRGL